MKTKNFVSVTSSDRSIRVSPSLRADLKRAVAFTLESVGFAYPAEVSVTFVTPEKIRELHSEYRGKDAPTDVLSFPELDDPAHIADADRDFSRGGCVLLGDVILCPDVIAAQAGDFSHTYEQECVYMTIHSVLHLLGYDHTSPADNGVHEKTQDEIYSRFAGEKKD